MLRTPVLFFVFLTTLFVHSGVTAQTDSTDNAAEVKKMLTMIEQLQRNQEALEQLQEQHSERISEVQEAEEKIEALRDERQQSNTRVRQLRDSLNESSQRLNQLVEQIDKYRAAIEKQEAVIRDVTRRVELTDEARYVTVRNNLENIMSVFELLNQKLNTLNAISQVDSYRNSLAALNNPADASMGFSYNEKVLELLNKKINPRRGKDRLLRIAESILTNPTVSTITQNTPILNIGTTLLSFISNIAINDKRVEPEHIFEFKQELDKYTQYYVSLNETSRALKMNMHDFQVQTKQLHSKLQEFVVKTVEAGRFEVVPRSNTEYDSEGAYLAFLFRDYNKDYIQRHTSDLERRYQKGQRVDYGRLLQENPHLIEMSKYAAEVDYLFKQFDYLYSKYIAILEKNHSDMIAILEQAKANGLSDDNRKIDRKVAQLQAQKKDAVQSIRTAINIERISVAIDRLDLYYMGGGF